MPRQYCSVVRGSRGRQAACPIMQLVEQVWGNVRHGRHNCIRVRYGGYQARPSGSWGYQLTGQWSTNATPAYWRPVGFGTL